MQGTCLRYLVAAGLFTYINFVNSAENSSLPTVSNEGESVTLSTHANLGSMSSGSSAMLNDSIERVLEKVSRIEKPINTNLFNRNEKINHSEVLLNALLDDDQIIKLLKINGTDLAALHQTIELKSPLQSGDYSLSNLLIKSRFEPIELTQGYIATAKVKEDFSTLSILQELLMLEDTFAAQLLISHGITFENTSFQIAQLLKENKRKVIQQREELKLKYIALNQQELFKENNAKDITDDSPEYQLIIDTQNDNSINETNDLEESISVEFYAAVLTTNGLQFIFGQTPKVFEFTSEKIAAFASVVEPNNSLSMVLQTKEYGGKYTMGSGGGQVSMVFDDSPLSKSDIKKIVAKIPDMAQMHSLFKRNKTDLKMIAEKAKKHFESGNYDPAIGFVPSNVEDANALDSKNSAFSSASDDNSASIQNNVSFPEHDEIRIISSQAKSDEGRIRSPVDRKFILRVVSEDRQAHQFKAVLHSNEGLQLYVEETPFEIAIRGSEIKILVDSVEPIELIGELFDTHDNTKATGFSGRRGAIFFSPHDWNRQNSGSL